MVFFIKDGIMNNVKSIENKIDLLQSQLENHKKNHFCLINKSLYELSLNLNALKEPVPEKLVNKVKILSQQAKIAGDEEKASYAYSLFGIAQKISALLNAVVFFDFSRMVSSGYLVNTFVISLENFVKKHTGNSVVKPIEPFVFPPEKSSFSQTDFIKMCTDHKIPKNCVTIFLEELNKIKPSLSDAKLNSLCQMICAFHDYISFDAYFARDFLKKLLIYTPKEAQALLLLASSLHFKTKDFTSLCRLVPFVRLGMTSSDVIILHEKLKPQYTGKENALAKMTPLLKSEFSKEMILAIVQFVNHTQPHLDFLVPILKPGLSESDIKNICELFFINPEKWNAFLKPFISDLSAEETAKIFQKTVSLHSWTLEEILDLTPMHQQQVLDFYEATGGDYNKMNTLISIVQAENLFNKSISCLKEKLSILAVLYYSKETIQENLKKLELLSDEKLKLLSSYLMQHPIEQGFRHVPVLDLFLNHQIEDLKNGLIFVESCIGDQERSLGQITQILAGFLSLNDFPYTSLLIPLVKKYLSQSLYSDASSLFLYAKHGLTNNPTPEKTLKKIEEFWDKHPDKGETVAHIHPKIFQEALNENNPGNILFANSFHSQRFHVAFLNTKQVLPDLRTYHSALAELLLKNDDSEKRVVAVVSGVYKMIDFFDFTDESLSGSFDIEKVKQDSSVQQLAQNIAPFLIDKSPEEIFLFFQKVHFLIHHMHKTWRAQKVSSSELLSVADVLTEKEAQLCGSWIPFDDIESQKVLSFIKELSLGDNAELQFYLINLVASECSFVHELVNIKQYISQIPQKRQEPVCLFYKKCAQLKMFDFDIHYIPIIASYWFFLKNYVENPDEDLLKIMRFFKKVSDSKEDIRPFIKDAVQNLKAQNLFSYFTPTQLLALFTTLHYYSPFEFLSSQAKEINQELGKAAIKILSADMSAKQIKRSVAALGVLPNFSRLPFSAAYLKLQPSLSSFSPSSRVSFLEGLSWFFKPDEDVKLSYYDSKSIDEENVYLYGQLALKYIKPGMTGEQMALIFALIEKTENPVHPENIQVNSTIEEIKEAFLPGREPKLRYNSKYPDLSETAEEKTFWNDFFNRKKENSIPHFTQSSEEEVKIVELLLDDYKNFHLDEAGKRILDKETLIKKFRRAYRLSSRAYHPDKPGGSAEKFQQYLSLSEREEMKIKNAYDLNKYLNELEERIKKVDAKKPKKENSV